MKAKVFFSFFFICNVTKALIPKKEIFLKFGYQELTLSCIFLEIFEIKKIKLNLFFGCAMK